MAAALVTWEIDTPEGDTIEIDAPADANPEEVKYYAQRAAPALRQKKLADEYAGEDVSKMGALKRGLGGAKHTWDRWAYGLKDMVTDLSPEEKRLLEQGKAFNEEAGTASKVGGFAAELIPSIAAGGFATAGLRGATAGLPLARAAALRTVGELGTGAALGAVSAMPGERGEGAAWGAGGSALGMGVNRLIGGAVRPLVTEEAEALMREGVQPTVGQSVGGNLGKLEEKMMSAPGVGGAIRNARDRALNEFNERAIQQAAPGVAGIGDEALEAAHGAISAQYQRALGMMPNNITINAMPVQQAAQRVARDPQLGLNQASREYIVDYVNNSLLGRGQTITPEIAKRVESDLGAVVRRLVNSADGEQRATGMALQRIQNEWRNSLTGIANIANPGAGTALREADAAWRAFLPVDAAAASATSQSGEVAGRFTPKVLHRALRAADKSMNDRGIRYAGRAGNAPFDRLNRLAQSGVRVLPDRVPDSGTAGRLGAVGTAGLMGGLAASGQWGALGALGAGAALGNLGSTRAGQTLLTQGFEPAVRWLVGNGATQDAAIQLVQQYGPDAILAMARAQAQQQNNSE